MKQRRRIYYSAAQRSEIWDRWQAGEPMSAIGRRFDRESSSVFSVISPTGGIRPPDRRRSKQTLSLSEREEISRWLSMRRSLRSIATHLGRSASTISREVHRNGGSDCYRAARSDQAAWDRARRPKLCKLACRPARLAYAFRDFATRGCQDIRTPDPSFVVWAVPLKSWRSVICPSGRALTCLKPQGISPVAA
jgi:DNA-binding CsgD family transcriptional regulator